MNRVIRRAAWSLPELAVAAALWGLIAGLLLSALLAGRQALEDGRKALGLCLLAASLDAEIRAATAVLKPTEGHSAERLRLAFGPSHSVEYFVDGDALVAVDSRGGQQRVLDRPVDFAVFHFRAASGRSVVRYFTALSGYPLLSSCAFGGSECRLP